MINTLSMLALERQAELLREGDRLRAAARLRQSLRRVSQRGQLGPTRELELFEFLAARSVGGR